MFGRFPYTTQRKVGGPNFSTESRPWPEHRVRDSGGQHKRNEAISGDIVKRRRIREWMGTWPMVGIVKSYIFYHTGFIHVVYEKVCREQVAADKLMDFARLARVNAQKAVTFDRQLIKPVLRAGIIGDEGLQ